MKNSLLSLMFLVAGCGKSELFLNVFTPSFIEKQEIIFESPAMEATPIIWEGELKYVVFNRDEQRVEIKDDSETTLVYQGGPDESLGLGSAIVVDSSLHIFITKNWTNPTNGHGIYQITSVDLSEFTDPLLVIPASTDGVYFNTSVAQVDDDNFVMAIEICRPNTNCFSVKFMESSNLTDWVPVGSVLNENEYTACPTIRFIDGYYYVFYLKDVGHFVTYVSRSQDLINWEHSDIAVLSSLGAEGEGNNNSDMDLIEFEGEVLINYAIGDQLTWSGIKSATFQGSLNEFVLRFF